MPVGPVWFLGLLRWSGGGPVLIWGRSAFIIRPGIIVFLCWIVGLFCEPVGFEQRQVVFLQVVVFVIVLEIEGAKEFP